MRGSLILKTDSYKVTHWRQYPPGTTGVYSYMESRGGRWPTSVFFGLQYLLREYVVGAVVTRPGIEEADEFFSKHLGDRSLFNREGWEYVLRVHGGRLPVRIKAVPEGSPVWNRNVLMTIENTDPHVAWLTNYLETLLVQVWYPTTVATQSREMKRIWHGYLVRTGDPSLIAFKLHDFGYRGSTSDESAALGGAAHLVNFTGTDNLAGCELAMRYYRAQMPGFSIPAAEHSTITAWGRERELEAYANMLRAYPDSPLIAVVSDSYDIFYAVSELWGKRLRDAVMARRGAVVIRPDSGKPDEVVLSVLRRLAAAFGVRVNAKGYKVLDDHVRVIQGDGIDYHTIRDDLGGHGLGRLVGRQPDDGLGRWAAPEGGPRYPALRLQVLCRADRRHLVPRLEGPHHRSGQKLQGRPVEARADQRRAHDGGRGQPRDRRDGGGVPRRRAAQRVDVRRGARARRVDHLNGGLIGPRGPQRRLLAFIKR